MKCPWCDGSGETGERETRQITCPRCKNQDEKRSDCFFCKESGRVDVYSGEHVQSMIYDRVVRENGRMRAALEAAGIKYEEEK